MNEYDVKKLISEDREERGPGCFGIILILVSYGLIFWMIHHAGKDYTALKERVKQLEAQVEK